MTPSHLHIRDNCPFTTAKNTGQQLTSYDVPYTLEFFANPPFPSHVHFSDFNCDHYVLFCYLKIIYIEFGSISYFRLSIYAI